MTRHRKPTRSTFPLAVALVVALVVALTLVFASAQARETAPASSALAGAAGVTPVTHHVYIALPANVGTSSWTDQAVLDEVRAVTAYWKDEAGGQITDFVLPASPLDATRFATFQTSVDPGVVCGFGDFDTLAAEAGARFPGVGFGPFDGDAAILVIVTPDQGCSSATAGYAGIGPGFHAGGVVMSRSTASLRATLAHEMGHTFGLGHSNLGDEAYRNIYNVMGVGIAGVNPLTALSSAYRVGAGIDAPGEVKTLDLDPSVPRSVTEIIRPRSDETGLRGLSITPPDTRRPFYVDYRSGTGQDLGSAYATGRLSAGHWFGPGVVVEETRTTGNGLEVALLPATAPTASQIGQAAAGPGQTWTSPSGSVSVSVVSTSPGEGAKVTVTYTPPPPFSNGEAIVSGQPVFGSVMHAQHAGFIPDPVEVERQWLRDGDAIANATGSSYTATAQDVGHQLSVRVTAYRPGRLPTSVVSAPLTVQPRAWTWSIPPHLTTASPVAGQPVSVWFSYLGATAVESLQWYADGIAIAGATATAFVPSASQVGQVLTARVTLQAPGWTSLSLPTTPSAPVAAAEPDPDPDPDPDPEPDPSPGPTTPTPTTTPIPTPTSPSGPTSPAVPGALTGQKPTINGKLVVGKRLRVATGVWPAGTTFFYRWLADGKPLRRATAATLTVKGALVGTRLSVRVTAAKPGYPNVTVVSARTRRVVG